MIPGVLNAITAKIGVVMLAKFSGDAAVGTYAAANGLVERLYNIPDSIGMAVFPTIAVLYSISRQEAGVLFRRVVSYAIMLGLPIAVGTTVLADPIVTLVY